MASEDILYLRQDERPLFAGLALDIRSGFQVETDAESSPPDSAERMGVRISLLHAAHPAAKAVAQWSKNVRVGADWETIVRDCDLSEIDEDHWRQLLVALGPYGLSAIITGLLPRAASREDMELIASLSAIRKTLGISRSLSARD
jgi:hypothetical protein